MLINASTCLFLDCEKFISTKKNVSNEDNKNNGPIVTPKLLLAND